MFIFSGCSERTCNKMPFWIIQFREGINKTFPYIINGFFGNFNNIFFPFSLNIMAWCNIYISRLFVLVIHHELINYFSSTLISNWFRPTNCNYLPCGIFILISIFNPIKNIFHKWKINHVQSKNNLFFQ